jgi:hypothetical protein
VAQARGRTTAAIGACPGATKTEVRWAPIRVKALAAARGQTQAMEGDYHRAATVYDGRDRDRECKVDRTHAPSSRFNDEDQWPDV